MLTAEQAADVRARYDCYEAWRGKRNGIPVEEIPEWRPTNEETSALEVYEWHATPPERYFLYIKREGSATRGTAGTWMGDKLGDVVFGRAYRDNFGGTRVPVTVFGTNGVKYVGTYYQSAGDYARIRRAKAGPKRA
jgi:hypothetical protein